MKLLSRLSLRPQNLNQPVTQCGRLLVEVLMPRRTNGDGPNVPQYKNITLDTETGDALKALQENLEHKMGFRPTMSQCIKFLIRKANLADSSEQESST
jgi:hypothetical protein